VILPEAHTAEIVTWFGLGRGGACRADLGVLVA
jgi:hypothetical protein